MNVKVAILVVYVLNLSEEALPVVAYQVVIDIFLELQLRLHHLLQILNDVILFVILFHFDLADHSDQARSISARCLFTTVE